MMSGLDSCWPHWSGKGLPTLESKDVVILGGGISGLTALHYVRRLHPNLSVLLCEAENRLGGTIGTDQVEGYSFDWGPNGFLDREPLTLELCHDLGLQEKIERANPNVSNRFILRGNRLRSVPMSPPKFLTSDILSVRGRMRVMLEPFSASRPEGTDESIYDFGKRRIGKEAADYLIQPMVSGVYGGMAERLSLQSCFPVMREMEDQYGSLFKAMISKARAARKRGEKSGGPSGPGGWLTSFEGGLYRLIEGFEANYSESIRVDCPATQVTRSDTGYRIEFSSGETEVAKNLILATPSNRAAEIVSELSPELSKALGAIDYAPISVICLGYDAGQIRDAVNGFGFLVPKLERRRLLGSIWTSSIFRHRAPEGKVQFRCMVGGDGDHDSIKLSDEELISIVTGELSEIMAVSGRPEMVRLYRWKHGIPQFKIGHIDRMAEIDRQLEKLGGIFVTGNAYHGIGLNDCVKQSFKVASSLSSLV
ncbi:MAG: protoporphyrinogen oxidase [bacterium]|nr:protoporphyrinogen oxidase [bacterium]